MEHKTCQNCKNDFTIESEDFAFYDKLKVPAPTFCPDCRLQRRVGLFNLTKLYKRNCDLCKKSSLSMYHPDAPYTVYCPKCWWSDDWDPLDYGQDYDFSRPFFEQFREIWRKVPMLGLSNNITTMTSSDFTNHVASIKDCYLVFQANYIEDSAYSTNCARSRELYESNNILFSEKVYDSIHVFKGHSIVGCYNIFESLNCYFCRDCVNCQDCFGCTNLKNKKYCFFNEQLTKEEYREKISAYNLGSFHDYKKAQRDCQVFWRTQTPRPLYQNSCNDCTGNYLFESNNCKESFDVGGGENSKYVNIILNPKITDSYDITSWGENLSQSYESVIVGNNSDQMFFVAEGGYNSKNIEYGKLTTTCEDCFGCLAIRKKKYCLFNKQYTKEEYFELRKKIIQHMNDMPYTDKQGREYRYGEFFPLELSPFEYKYSMAQNFFPLIDEEVAEQGYTQYPDIETEHQPTIQAIDLPDNIKDVSDTLLQEVIGCEKTGKAFRITAQELQFLRQMNLPLPRIAPLERINEKINLWIKEKNLIERQSSISGEKFMTHYTEEEAPYILSPEEYKSEFL